MSEPESHNAPQQPEDVPPVDAPGAEATDASVSPELDVRGLDDTAFHASEAPAPDTDEQRHPVELLADEFIARLRRGESPSVSEYAQRHPELADDIRELFPTIAAMERLKQGKERSSDGRASLGPIRLERLGDYRIIREIGRGGMGIVYEAEQESLRRRVAVKVLPRQALLDSKQLRRFQREARTAARLHHTNIVPIFGVGEQDGYHYYVMQYIRGVGLDQILRYLAESRSSPTQGEPPPEKLTTRRDLDDAALTRIGAALLRGDIPPRRSPPTSSTDDTTESSGFAPEVATGTDRTPTMEAPTQACGGAVSGRPSELLSDAVASPKERRDDQDGPVAAASVAITQPGPTAESPTPDGSDATAPVEEPSSPRASSGSPLGPSHLKRDHGAFGDAGTAASGPRPTAWDRPVAASAHGPLYWKNAARIAWQVADALAYAHDQGTLHRDIKPANLLLDIDGHVWITDFGLAKAIQHDDISQTGDIVGTLRYMAPEQFHGRADERSDIYSLGLTLYELLTWRPAFEDTSREGLIRRITHEEPPPPRRWNPDVPRDLETIVLKAMSREPTHRYQTAAELADDLQRFLNDEPIRARRISPVERLWRWCRRNRALAAASGSAILLLILVAVITSVGYIQTRRANRLVAQALQGEREQRHRAEMTSQLALNALDRIFDQLAPTRITTTAELTVSDDEGQEYEVPTQPVVSREVASLLQNLLVFYDKLAEEADDESRLRQKAADASRRVGDIRCQLGQYPLAEQAYRKAINIYRSLLAAGRASASASSPAREAKETNEGEATSSSKEDAPVLTVELATVYNQLGNLYRATRRFDAMYRAHRNALQILDQIPPSVASSPRARYERARTYYFLARPTMRRVSGGFFWPHRPPVPPAKKASGPASGSAETAPGQASSKSLSETARHSPQLQAARPGPDRRRHGGRPPRLRRRVQEHGRQAIQLLEELVEEYPHLPEYRYLLALCYRDLPVGRPDSDRRPIGSDIQQATKLLEQLVEENPDVPDYRFELSQTYSIAANPVAWKTRPDDAVIENQLRQAIEHLARLTADYPQVPEYAAAVARVHHQLGLFLQFSARSKTDERQQRDAILDKAEQQLRAAIDRQQKLVAGYPRAPIYQVLLARFHCSLAELLRSRGRTAEAVVEARQAVRVLDVLPQADTRPWFVHAALSRGFSFLAECCREDGDHQGAETALQKAKEHRQRMKQLFANRRAKHRNPGNDRRSETHPSEQSGRSGAPA
ncbi:MAG: protein kinase, partial [Planctomycetes bacterium]|nr:protein kinase [Planctomycetota bacterium]